MDRNHGDIVEKGELIGNCPACGIVHGDEIEDFGFPNDPLCSCGRRLDEARIAPNTIEIT